MNRIEIDSDHWVERYLGGRLSETESRRFEAYWIENPDLIRDLERGARLKSGLAEMRESGELPSLMHASSWWPGRFRLLVLAASVAVVAIGAALWSGGRDAAAGVMLAATPAALPGLDGAVLPRGSVHAILRLRRASRVDAVIALPATPQALELRVLPELDAGAGTSADGAPDPSRYTATLTPEDGAAGAPGPWRAANLTAAADGFVSLFVDSRALPPGRYRLRLESAGADAAGAGFVIDVRAGAPAP